MWEGTVRQHEPTAGWMVRPGQWAMRLASVAIGTTSGVAIGLALGDRQWIAVAALAVGGFALAGLVGTVVPRGQRREIAIVIAIAFTVRAAAAALLYTGSAALGMDGFTSGDDRLYADVGWYMAQFWHGSPVGEYVPPDWNGYAFLIGTYTYVVAAVFYLFGFQLLAMDFTNCALGAAVVVLLWDIARRLFGTRPALVTAVLIAILPSLIVFSAVNLKDALNTFLVTAAFWSVLRFQLNPSLLWLLAAYLALEPMRAIRTHIFVGVAALLPIAVALTPKLTTRRRFAWSGVAAALSASLLIGNAFLTGTGVLSGQLLQDFERVRTAQAIGRTAIEEARPTAVPSSRISTTPSVTVGPSGTPLPTPLPTLEPETSLLGRTLAYLPTGLIYALFAPFPWAAERVVDLAAIPETLAWYAILAGMLWSLWRYSASARFTAVHVLYVFGLIALFALVEGNVGTLLRHRALLTPFAILVASPALASLTATARLAVSRSRSRT